MAGRVGPRLDRGLGLDRVDRPQRRRPAGTYPDRGRGAGVYGGTAYPTVLEAYNRDSDYKRWRSGLDYWIGSGKSWADVEQTYLLRSFRDFGVLPGPELVTATLFPSNTSPDAAWTVVNRRRGAVVLPQALRQQDISFKTDAPQPGLHRLVLDVSGTLTPLQLGEWTAFIGDQFEDSATGTTLPQGLIADPIDTIAYTLAEVDSNNGRLLFDLSRPYMRRRPNPLTPRAFWQRILYDRRRPLSWRGDGSRYLCSSHRFYCSCPDFSGMYAADLVNGITGSQAMFPRPSAGRSVDGRWEAEVAGYKRRWRDLAPRADGRRECKHIHAARWSVGYPFYEPSDYEVGAEDRQFTGSQDERLTSGEVLRYHGRRGLTLDRLAPALADSHGIQVDSRDTIGSDEQAPVQPGRPPILWTSTREPSAYRAQTDDWWLQRGTSTLRVFDPGVQRFVETKAVGGQPKPVIEPFSPDQLIPVEP
jgi:hypothetical protein